MKLVWLIAFLVVAIPLLRIVMPWPGPPKPRLKLLPVCWVYLEGIQWFGSTQNAWGLWHKGDKIYDYCQGLHCGLDLLAPWSTPVRAGLEGVVEFAGESRYEGPNKVVIRVGDYFITYGHMTGRIKVKRGDKVEPWTILGYVGNMGGKWDSYWLDHLHLEIRNEKKYPGESLNPLQFMDDALIDQLIQAAEGQIERNDPLQYPPMAKFTDGTDPYNPVFYPPPGELCPDRIKRGLGSFWE